MIEQALIANVTRRSLGSALADDLGGGELALLLESVDDFPDGGGELVIAPGDDNAESLTWTEVDDATGEVILDASTPVVFAWERGTIVHLSPEAVDHEVACFLDGQTDGDPLIARLPHSLEALVPEGTRDPGLGESVLVEQRGLDWIVVDVLGQRPNVQSGGLLWGGVTDDLVAFGLDEFGEQVAELGSIGPGFAALYVGELSSPSVPSFGVEDVTYYVDPDDGDDDADGLTVLTPLASIAEAVARVPRFNSGDVTIYLLAGSTVNEIIAFESFVGAGSITVDGQSMSTTTLVGGIIVDGCSMDLNLYNFTVDDDTGAGDSPPDSLASCSLYVRNSRLLTTKAVRFYAHGAKAENALVQASNAYFWTDTEFHGATDQCILAGPTANVTAIDTKGNSLSGIALQTNGGSIRLGGTRMQGTVSGASVEKFGGRVTDDSTSSVAGGSSGGGTKHTRYWNATDTGSWRNAFGGEWRSDTSDVYEGSYYYGNHRGCWFYDFASIRSVLDSKHIDAAYIYVSRKAQGGQSAPIGLRLWTHDRSSQSGMPNLAADQVIASMGWGARRWIKIPASFVERIRDNTNGAKGLALYVPSGSPYGIFAGKSSLASSGRLKVTYH